jgi:hypothetical protein
MQSCFGEATFYTKRRKIYKSKKTNKEVNIFTPKYHLKRWYFYSEIFFENIP